MSGKAETTIGFVGTQSFWDNTDLLDGNPAVDATDYVENAWKDFINDSNGNYDLLADLWGENGVAIPYDAFSTSGELLDHLKQAEDWLKNNWGSYGEYDTIHVLHWWGGEENQYGVAWVGAAGEYRKCSITDFYWEWDGMGSTFDQIGMDGVVFHENLHVYCAGHNDSGSNSNCEATIMHNPTEDKLGCFNGCSNPSTIIRDITSCTQSVVRCFIDGGSNPDQCDEC